MKMLMATAACGALMLAGEACAQVRPNASIVVRGHGQVEAPADTFKMTAEVIGRGADQASAIQQMAASQRAVTDGISALEGLTEARVTTGLPSVTPAHSAECPPGNKAGCIPTDYVATLEVVMEGMPAERGGDAVSLAAERGARNARLTGVFLNSDDDLRREATRQAFADARRQADDIALASGQRVGRVVQVEESGRDIMVFGLYSDADATYGANGYFTPQTSIRLTPGPIDVEASLQVTFELE